MCSTTKTINNKYVCSIGYQTCIIVFIYVMNIELTTVDSSDGSSSGVRASEDLRCPFLPNGILVPLPDNNEMTK